MKTTASTLAALALLQTACGGIRTSGVPDVGPDVISLDANDASTPGTDASPDSTQMLDAAPVRDARGGTESGLRDAPRIVSDVPDTCVGTPGTWVNVTHAAALTSGQYGAGSIQADPARPQDVYTQFEGAGIWKSTDYGCTWTGPINSSGLDTTDAVCYLHIPSNSTAVPALLYMGCDSGNSQGFWRSTDGGVNWTRHDVPPAGATAGFYDPDSDPYDPTHLIMNVHYLSVLLETTDSGDHWNSIPMDPMMMQGMNGEFKFIDTGNPETTRTTFLWIAQLTGGSIGSWRTANAGATWTQVDHNERAGGPAQIYQPGSGVVYMGGIYSGLGDGVLRSTDYGSHWTHVGASEYGKLVLGTPRHVYSLSGGQAGGPSATNFQIADSSGTTWTSVSTPAEETEGPTMATVTNDGTYNIILTANYAGGLWRYVEPAE